MSDRLVLGGKLNNLQDPSQLGRLNDLLAQLCAITNNFDANSFALAWIDGDVAGKVIVSKGVGNAPEWDASPTLTGATFSGLTASKGVFTDAAKALTSTGTLGVPQGGTGAATFTDNGVIYGNAAAAFGATAEGATGTVLIGTTGAAPSFSGSPTLTGSLTVGTGFGCNGQAAQTAYASGGALAAYGAGANGFDTEPHAAELHAMVVKIRAALVANGIMS